MPSGGARPGVGRPRKVTAEGERQFFSSEEIELLLQSPHVAYVSRTTVSYTLAFKKMFWQRYCDGVPPTRIFEEAGLSVDVIGKSRIDTLIKALRSQMERGLGFKEGREPQPGDAEKLFDLPRIPRYPKNSQIPLAPESIAKLVHEVEYLKQEMEFLKKIISAGRVEK
jgi:hypothetical protein